MNTKMNHSLGRVLVVLLTLSITLTSAYGQITAVSPDAAAQGTTGLTVTITLDADADPPIPPSDAPVDRVTIGTLAGTSVSRVSETVVTAVFNIPAGEGTGLKDVSVTFSGVPTEGEDPADSGPPPEDQDPVNSDAAQGSQDLTFTLTGGFTVTAMADTAPTIITEPVSRAVRLDSSVTLTVGVYGSEPLSYQWLKDDVDIVDANTAAYTIDAFAEENAGDYYCWVSNEFGFDLSEVAVLTVDDSTSPSYVIQETGQTTAYDEYGNVIAVSQGETYYGQDAHYDGIPQSFQDNGDGTVTDLNTGLMWQQTPPSDGYGWEDAATYCENLALAGYDDWRLPTLKELFAIGNYSEGWPYLDATYFDIAGATVSKDEQYWAQENYVGVSAESGSNGAFGVNHGTGHIKCYPSGVGPGGGKRVRAVRGAITAINDFTDNGDGTITDHATGLMWSQADNGEGLLWKDALAYAEDANLAGYDDWRLPNVKELQSIVDYSYSPTATDPNAIGPAIDPIFSCSSIINEAGNDDYPYFWTSTSARFQAGLDFYYAWYVAFGMAVNGAGEDHHGAGAVRFDTKALDGPAGEDAERYYNYVRLVRDATVTYPIVDTNQGLCYGNAGQIDPPAEGEAFYGQDAQYTGTPPSYTDNGDGTITDNVTGLIWTQEISSYSMAWSDAFGYCESLETGGYTDWRLPTVKELWSIRDYSQGWPWVDTDYFYLVGDGSDLAQHHSWTCDPYLIESEYQNEQVQGDPAWIVNDWTGHIKAMSGNRFVRAVRGRTDYGINDFVDNGDGTVTDKATGLMWSQDDNGEHLCWEDALAYAENATTAGYDDWRLPNIKELQSIADYTAEVIPAMDTSVFNLTEVTNTIYDLETGDVIDTQVNYPFYWSSTSNPVEGDGEDIDGGTLFAWFYASGYNTFPDGYDLHGAGSVCFGAKSDDNAGLENSVELMVRLVRGGGVIETPDGDPDCINEDRVVVFPDGDTGMGGGGAAPDDEGGPDFAPGVEYLATLGITVTAQELEALIGGPPAPTASEVVANCAASDVAITEAQAQALLDTLNLL